MKNNTFRILVSITVLVLFCAILTGCDSSHQTEQETTQAALAEMAEKTTQTVTEEKTTLSETQAEQEKLTGWRGAYSEVVVQTLKDCKEKYPDEINHGQYGLYDFDGDNVPELFLKVYVPDEHIRVYDYEDDEAVFLDSIQAAHSWVYGTDKDNALLLGCFGTGGECAWSLLRFRDGKFDSEYIESYFPYGFGDIIEPEENPLPGMGYKVDEIKSFGLDDMTGIKE